MGEVPAKDSLTSMYVLKQGDEEKEGEWEEEIRGRWGDKTEGSAQIVLQCWNRS